MRNLILALLALSLALATPVGPAYGFDDMDDGDTFEDRSVSKEDVKQSEGDSGEEIIQEIDNIGGGEDSSYSSSSSDSDSGSRDNNMTFNDPNIKRVEREEPRAEDPNVESEMESAGDEEGGGFTYGRTENEPSAVKNNWINEPNSPYNPPP